MSLREFDAWLGRRIFHPPIIWVCQRAGLSQFAFYRYAWWLFALWAVASDNHRNAVQTVWLALFALLRTLNAGLSLNRPAPQSFVLRMLFVGFLAIELVLCAANGKVRTSVFRTILALLAEYATTIVTIPPRLKRERAVAGKAVTT